MRSKIVLVLLGLAILSGVTLSCLTIGYFSLHETARDILIGFFASSLVVLFVEAIALLRERKRFSYLEGPYKRIEIHNKLKDPKQGKFYENMTQFYFEERVDPHVDIESIGEGHFKGTVDYKEGKVEFDIVLDRINPSYGVGTFQYIQKKSDFAFPDLGHFEVFRDKANGARVFLHHSNLIPTGEARGFEIWEKC